jgi:predicted transcriptional regulator
LLKFINKSLLHHMIILVRDYPSYEIIENSINMFADSVATVYDDTTHINVEEILNNKELNEMDKDIIYLLIRGHTQEEIAQLFGVKQATIHYRLKNKIRRVIKDER